jgi:hypothetical protein
MPGDSESDPLQQSSEVPAFVRFTEYITDDPDPDKTAPNADMLLLFLAAAGTVLGSLLGGIVYFAVTAPHSPTFSWLVRALASVAIGGICGCGTVMGVLHFRQMITWESRRRRATDAKSLAELPISLEADRGRTAEGADKQ